MMNIRKIDCRGMNQRGMALISALLMLLVLSLMAVGLSMDSSMNVRIAGFQRLKARSFGFAESGLMASTDLLEDNIYEAGWEHPEVTPATDPPTYDPREYPNLSDNYVGTLNILGDGAFYMDDNPGSDGEGETTMEMRGDIEADIAVQKLAAKVATGGAMQVAAGYAGIGKSQAAGGTHILYNINSSGVELHGAETKLAMHYRVVTK